MSRTSEARRRSRPAVAPKPDKTDDPFGARVRGLSKEALAEKFDYNTKCRVSLQKALKKIPKGVVWSDKEMREECGVSNNHGWRDVAEEEDFLKYQFSVGGDRHVFWARPETVKWACQNIAKAKPLAEPG